MDQNQKKQIDIQLGEKEAEGIYSNLALITHSPAEFIIDFTRILPGSPKTKVFARVIMTPQHAKSFLEAMKNNIEKYENQFGEISNIPDSARNHPIGFQPPENHKESKE
ncbi:MAG: DUF3467 domain-containing protein [candidate division KSB1 bacterium]|nr:DUF3467 domain-containing protein [candidate division KSB1 bacterium]